MSNYVLDIETGANTPEVTAQFKPEFEAAGNLKDPIKIAQSILEKELAWKETLALDPITGVVLAIGLKEIGKDSYTIFTGDEKSILTKFWDFVAKTRPSPNGFSGATRSKFVGHYLHSFDFSFVVRRSWLLGVPVPQWVIQYVREWSEEGFIDTAKVWQLNGFKKDDKYIGLDVLARALGVGEKLGEGKDFAKLLSTDEPAAIAYLKRDLDLTEGVALKIVPNLV